MVARALPLFNFPDPTHDFAAGRAVQALGAKRDCYLLES